MTKIAILVANGTEMMEALDPFDILSREESVEPHLISVENTQLLKAAPAGFIQSTHNYKDIKIEDYDVLLLPGGPGHETIDTMKDIDSILDHFISNDKLIAAICAAPSILGKRNLLNGKNAISWEGKHQELLGANIINKPVVVDGSIITSKNNMTSTLFGIEIVRKIKGDERAKYLENKMM